MFFDLKQPEIIPSFTRQPLLATTLETVRFVEHDVSRSKCSTWYTCCEFLQLSSQNDSLAQDSSLTAQVTLTSPLEWNGEHHVVVIVMVNSPVVCCNALFDSLDLSSWTVYFLCWVYLQVYLLHDHITSFGELARYWAEQRVAHTPDIKYVVFAIFLRSRSMFIPHWFLFLLFYVSGTSYLTNSIFR